MSCFSGDGHVVYQMQHYGVVGYKVLRSLIPRLALPQHKWNGMKPRQREEHEFYHLKNIG